jgi:uncharacterized protein (TIGR00725 family)
MERVIAVFGASRSTPGDPHYAEGEHCGRLLAEAGFTVATGGYGGTMEAASKGAREAGGRVVGVTAPSVFPARSGPNAHLTSETRADTLMERIAVLVEGSDGAIALWGSLGTACELLVAWNLSYVAPLSGVARKPIIAVGDPWRLLVPRLEVLLETERGLVTVVEDVRSAVDRLAALVE